MNTYEYVSGNPVNIYDPFGLLGVQDGLIDGFFEFATQLAENDGNLACVDFRAVAIAGVSGTFSLNYLARVKRIQRLARLLKNKFSKVPNKTVGRHMSPKELAKMRKTGKVQEGGGGQTRVADPSDPNTFKMLQKMMSSSNLMCLRTVYYRILKVLEGFPDQIVLMHECQAGTLPISKCHRQLTLEYQVRGNLMNNVLKDVLNAKRNLLVHNGITVSFKDAKQQGSCSANLDSAKYVGTITYWPETRFEFQFNSCESGDVVVLDTKEFRNEEGLAAFIEDLVATKLI